MCAGDFIVGVNEESEGLKHYTEVKDILKDASFNMHTWATNLQTQQSEFDVKVKTSSWHYNTRQAKPSQEFLPTESIMCLKIPIIIL